MKKQAWLRPYKAPCMVKCGSYVFATVCGPEYLNRTFSIYKNIRINLVNRSLIPSILGRIQCCFFKHSFKNLVKKNRLMDTNTKIIQV